MTPLQKTLRRGFRSLLKIYFRSVEVVGEQPRRETRGRVFVGNHSNALLDPVLVLTNAPCDMSPLAKSTLWNIPGLKYLLDIADAVPVLRRKDDPNKSAESNEAMFEKIAQHLAAGGNVLVFPEGTSHNEPQLIRLKTGAARMLARARSLGATDLTFQAVGLEFDEREAFRSRALVAYGPVRPLPELDGDALVESVTHTMRDDLAKLVIEGATWEERRLVLKVAELVRNESGDLSFAEAVRIAQAVEDARDELRKREPALAERTEASVRTYFEALAKVGATDDQLAEAEGDEAHSKLGRPPSALAWAALPLFPVGVALYWLPYQLPRFVASRTDEVDQHSTLKLATGMVAYPIWAGLLTAGAFALVKGPRARMAVLGGILASPFAALHWMKRIEELKPALALASRRDVMRDLQDKRAVALAAIRRARDVLELDT